MPSVEMIQTENVNEIVYGCCTSIVIANKTVNWSMDVFKTISCNTVVMLPASEAYSSCGRTRV